MSSVRTETETVIKRILPYLRRRGYEPENDIDFETPVQDLERYTRGYVDLLVNCGNKTPQFVIEAKRNGKKLTSADTKQALSYGKALKVPFVVITNGEIVTVYNTTVGKPLRWNGKLADRIPSKDQLKRVIAALRRDKTLLDVPLGEGADALPFRPALPLQKLNALFSRCHNKIRNIEKNEENAFADFSKLLFLKLLEEKADADDDFDLPYSYQFWELAELPNAKADQVRNAVDQMLSSVKKMGFGDVLMEDLHLKHPTTYQYIVRELSNVSFSDSDHDVKGTAFEYFVRATLKGKKLGQYFTPRPVIDLMTDLVGRDAIVEALRIGEDTRVLDPACGTGGFLVYSLNSSLAQVDALISERKLTKAAGDTLKFKLKAQVFYGCDANEGVAASAKMNMVVAGDGHTNIYCENSVSPTAKIWAMSDGEQYDYVLTNPPFGTTERDALTPAQAQRYPIPNGRGQHLFLQRMVMATKAGGFICTVIDDGLLNTETAADLRRWVMRHADIVAILQLPDVTFKPNKINVRSSILMLRKKESVDDDLLDTYDVAIGKVDNLGYHGTGEPIRGFDFNAVRDSITNTFTDKTVGPERSGPSWYAFDVSSNTIAHDPTVRWDRKYWEPRVRRRTADLVASDRAEKVAALNQIDTTRGKSPVASSYVDAEDGYAVVIKAGSSITRYGTVTLDGADWVEKQGYDDVPTHLRLQHRDVLLSSTGTGTLGKCAVWEGEIPAVADGHVTVIRVDPKVVDPYYLADYLRSGFGHDQVERLYTGSTGLIELTTEHVNSVVVPLLENIDAQRALSSELRTAEKEYEASVGNAVTRLKEVQGDFDYKTYSQGTT